MSRPPGEPIGTAYASPKPATHLQQDDQHILVAETSIFETDDHRQMALDQVNCPEMAAHKEGKHVKGLILQQIEFSPNIHLLCDISTKKARPIVPVAHRTHIMAMFHQLVHPGVQETVRRISHRYFWPKMKQDITQFVSTCHVCQSVKSKKTITPELSPKPVILPKMHNIQLDVVGPLTPSKNTEQLTLIS